MSATSVARAASTAGVAAYKACLRAATTNNERKACRDYCNIDTCPLDFSYWEYRPSLAANSVFLAIFALSLALFVGQAVLSRRFLGFTVAMVCGCVLEVIGYAGRIMSYHDPFSENGFLIQIICLTIAPAFLAAGLYFCLRSIVLTFGEENSRLPAQWYPRIFIPCDVVSLLLQAAGGGYASAATHADEDPTAGNDVMIAGLAFQVATLFVFILLSADFAARALRRVRRLGAADALDGRHERLRHSWAFKGFLAALGFATVCIFTRSVYRVAELSEGWDGHLINTQSYFIGLEGAIVGAAVLALNAFHPGLCFREGYTETRGALGFGRRQRQRQRQKGEAALASAAGPVGSDTKVPQDKEGGLGE